MIARVEGDNVYAKLKFESGAHRVQRVPETESQGRIHTSACTVAVLPEPDEQAAIEINPADLRVDTYRSSGAGGGTSTRPTRRCASPTFPAASWSSARKSARSTRTAPRPWPGWRPSSTTSSRPRREQAIASTRKLLVGSGDRSERIRTYNFPQGRVTDHRINLTLYSLGEVMEGAVEQVIEPLLQEYQADQLAALGD